MCVFLAKREVKMVGYWSICLLACLWTGKEIAFLIKDLLYLYEKKEHFYFGTQWLMKSGQDSALFPARATNHSAGFGGSSSSLCTAEDGEICEIVPSCTQWMPAVAVGRIPLKYHGASY